MAATRESEPRGCEARCSRHSSDPTSRYGWRFPRSRHTFQLPDSRMEKKRLFLEAQPPAKLARTLSHLQQGWQDPNQPIPSPLAAGEMLCTSYQLLAKTQPVHPAPLIARWDNLSDCKALPSAPGRRCKVVWYGFV